MSKANPKTDKAAIVRVDHAGEYGATRIYAGQLAVMGRRHPLAAEIERMAVQEDRHLARFEALVATHKVRPTLLMPLWKHAGFALGAASALLSPRAAMAVTAAVETEIDRHYQAQRDALGNSEPELSETIAQFQAEEAEHRDSAVAHGAHDTPAWPILSRVVKAGCRLAIRLSERL